MPCGWCRERVVTDPFHDTVDDQGILRLGAWRWASRCHECGALVDNRATAIQASADITAPTVAALPDVAAHALDKHSHDVQPTACVPPHADAS